MAKVLGTVTSIGGATVITLYKGLPLLPHPFSTNVFATPPVPNPILHWTLGCACLLGNCISWAGWMVLQVISATTLLYATIKIKKSHCSQVPVVKKYPARLSFSAFICFFGFLQCLVIVCIAETDSEKWKVHSVEELCVILYSVCAISYASQFASFMCPTRIESRLLCLLGTGACLVGRCHCSSDMVHRQRGSSFHCCLPASANCGCGHIVDSHLR